MFLFNILRNIRYGYSQGKSPSNKTPAYENYVHFVLGILFVLTLVSDMAVLYGNDALSIKKEHSSFFIKVFVFQKICFEVTGLKTFRISPDCHIKTWRSLKQRAILKIPSIVF